MLEIYSTGVGKIKIRGKAEIEKIKGGKEQIVITEIPYPMIGANIGKFLNDIYSLVESKKTNDITDISNQSSKDGMRIIVELRKGADAQNVLNLLYKKTRLEDTFGVNMLAVADGSEETMRAYRLALKAHLSGQFADWLQDCATPEDRKKVLQEIYEEHIDDWKLLASALPAVMRPKQSQQ